MAEVAHMPALAATRAEVASAPRHSLVVRVTHWVTVLGYAGLLVSGIAILIAHPRLYWGETGSLETASLIDLPLTLTLGHSGWGRYLHFASAWACVLAGLVYVTSGLAAGHFRRHLLPARGDLSWSSLAGTFARHLRLSALEDARAPYNVFQRLAYLAVVFILFPLAILTGLAMSPMVTSTLPVIVEMFGGHQSARTVHFVAACAVTLFVLVHLLMVSLTGPRARLAAIIAGDREERS